MAASEATARKELTQHFGSAVGDHPDVMTECLSMLRLYNLDPSALFFKYEAFVMSRPSGLRAKLSVLTLDTARELKKEIQREHQAKAVAVAAGSHTHSETPKSSGVGMRKGKGNMADLGGFLDGLSTPVRKSGGVPARLASNGGTAPSPAVGSPFGPQSSHDSPSKDLTPLATGSSYRPGPSKLATPGNGDYLSTPVGKTNGDRSGASSPVSGPESPSSLTAQTKQPFHLRPQPNTLVETLNPHLPQFRAPVPPPTRFRATLASTSTLSQYDYRYMFEKISQRSEALDDLIDEFAEGIKDAYGINELGDPHFASDDSIYAVGRILSGQTDSSKATASSLFLESSRLQGAGKRIGLRFAPGVKVRGGAPGVKGFGLFPGCMVCAKGRNGGGGVFVVEEVLMSPPSALPQTPAAELLEFQHGDKLRGQPLSMMVAAGPFTLDDDLLYQPLSALLDVVVEERPDVLILLGPFVDANHPLVASGSITQMPHDIFREQVSARLQRLLGSSPATEIILVPSVRDIVSRHMAFPQAMFDRETLGLPKRVRLLPNPCTFAINEIVISLSAVDILFHLRREELVQKAEEADPEPSQAAESKDTMAGLVRHVLGQRNFYPIFPPTEAHASEVNLDVTHFGLLKMDGPQPDLLILPSKLKHFSKIVDSTLVVNPSHLAKAHSAGTFAKITVHPMKRSELGDGSGMDLDEDLRDHALYDRARSEIWRI